MKGAYLKRCDEPDAIVALIGIMARTPRGSWAGCARFGLRDAFEDARNRPELPRETIAELNDTLTELGVTNYRVDTITREPGTASGHYSFVINLARGAEPPVELRMKV